ncbi:unnamed protein product [Miscanthus lutarioriparius]|uniref:Peptidyl-prolyl cis-trans isomerase n=1 Tax=Miscanthus lutarioriparius TaxID=422564 RepID=A0A811QLM0_9POAL|nr:unnamed protein product [Miscanthus lutarioriparius]
MPADGRRRGPGEQLYGHQRAAAWLSATGWAGAVPRDGGTALPAASIPHSRKAQLPIHKPGASAAQNHQPTQSFLCCLPRRVATRAAKIGSESPAADGVGDPARKRPSGSDGPTPAPADKRRRPEHPSSSSAGSLDRHQPHHHQPHGRRPPSSSAEEKVRASHILIKHEGSRRKASWRDPEGLAISATTRDDAADLARALRDQIVSGDRKFEDIAAENSDCSSAKRGGDLGSFGRGKMQKAFEKAAFALKVGEISDVVDTESGVHIIKRTG